MENFIAERNELAKDVSILRNAIYQSDGEDDSCNYFCVYDQDKEEESSESSRDVIGIPSTSGWTSPLSNLQEEMTVEDSQNNLEMCLYMNRSYQDALLNTIEQLEVMLENNEELQRNLQEELSETKEKGKVISNNRQTNSKFFNIFEAPYFKDINNQSPPPNIDTVTKTQNNEVTAYVIPHKTWTKREKFSLAKAVASNSKERLMDPLLLKKSILKDKLDSKNLDDEEEKNVVERLAEIQRQISNIDKKSNDECIGPRRTRLDWMKISAIGLDGSRTPEECEMMWNNFIHPSINKEEWKEAEDKSLLQISQLHQFKDWDIIAFKLRTNRTAWQCLKRYQGELIDKYNRGPWSKEEDALLKQIVEICKVGNYIPWHRVVFYVETRSRIQIIDRWKRSLCPEIRKGQWTLNEDMILVAAVKKHGCDWRKIAEYLPGRNNVQCRERYKNSLEDGIMVGSWTAAEDKKLLKLVKQFGEGKWAEVCQYLPGRTDNSVYQRYRLIKIKRPYLVDEVGTSESEDNSNERPLIRTVQCNKAINRRKEVYQAVTDKLEPVKTEEGTSSNTSSKNQPNNMMIMLDQLLDKTPRPIIKQRKPRIVEPRVRRKTVKEKATDAALDSFLLPLLALSSPFQKQKPLMLSSIEAAESLAAKSLIYKVFQVPEPQNDDKAKSTFDEERKKCIFDIFEHFVLGKDYRSIDDSLCIFPPNRTTMNGFRLLLSNRKRLALAVRKVTNVNLLSLLTTDLASLLTVKSENSAFKCAQCSVTVKDDFEPAFNYNNTQKSYSNVNKVEEPSFILLMPQNHITLVQPQKRKLENENSVVLHDFNPVFNHQGNQISYSNPKKKCSSVVANYPENGPSVVQSHEGNSYIVGTFVGNSNPVFLHQNNHISYSNNCEKTKNVAPVFISFTKDTMSVVDPNRKTEEPSSSILISPTNDTATVETQEKENGLSSVSVSSEKNMPIVEVNEERSSVLISSANNASVKKEKKSESIPSEEVPEHSMKFKTELANRYCLLNEQNDNEESTVKSKSDNTTENSEPEVNVSVSDNPIQTECQGCKNMKVLYNDLQLLKKRFMSAFFWPALLSSIHPSSSIRPPAPQIKRKQRTKERKRKTKKPWVSEQLKKLHLEKNHKLKEEPDNQPIQKRVSVPRPRKKNLEPVRRSSRHSLKPAITSLSNLESTRETSNDTFILPHTL